MARTIRTPAPDAGAALPRARPHRPRGGPPRASKRQRWRAAALIAVHLAIGAHVLHWQLAGRTLTPLEPSESIETLRDGLVNAGAVLFAVAILSTLVLGRFFCGWACHLVAYQDLCRKLLAKVGLEPRPVRSRLLVWVPLVVALHMFAAVPLARWLVGDPAPPLQGHFVKEDFWATFPSWPVALLTFLVDGFLIVWLLGGKGFCTYGCPYGAVFGAVDRAAPLRIRVTDACEGCGHCTATCSSDVRVHEEVARHGMVVDPACMRCLDCVSVCPKEALYVGFGRPPLATRDRLRALVARRPSAGELVALAAAALTPFLLAFPAWVRAPAARQIGGPLALYALLVTGAVLLRRTPRAARRHDFSWPEELAMVAAGAAAFFAFRGLYRQVSLLLAVGLAVIAAVLAVAAWRALRRGDFRFLSHDVRRGGRATRAGWVALALCAAYFGLIAHSFVVQWDARRAFALLEEAETRPRGDRAEPIAAALRHLRRSEARGLLARADHQAMMGAILREQGDDRARGGAEGPARELWSEAEEAYERALELDDSLLSPRLALSDLYLLRGDVDAALARLDEVVERDPENPDARLRLEAARERGLR